MKIKKLLFACAFIYCVAVLKAQVVSPQTLPTQGGTLNSTNGIINYSFGQSFSGVLSGGNNILSVGFLQPARNFLVDTIPVGPFCAGTQINVPFAASGIFPPNNAFIVQLSDASGSFANPIDIGSDSTTFSGTIVATIPVNATGGTAYRIRLIASDTTYIGTTAGDTSAIIINAVPQQSTPYASPYLVCAGDSTRINVPNSQGGIYFILSEGNTVIDSILGNGYNVILPPSAISVSTTFSVAAKDTTTGCSINLVPTVTVAVDSGPPTPFFVIGDTVLGADSISTYMALSIGSNQIIYAIDSGGASINSSSGVVSGVTSSFLVKATAIWGSGCASSYALLYVRVTHYPDDDTHNPMRGPRAQTPSQVPPVGEWEFTGGNLNGGDWVERIIETSDGGYVCVGYGYADGSEGVSGIYPVIFKLNNFGYLEWRTIDWCGGNIISGTYAFEDVVEINAGTASEEYVAYGTVSEKPTGNKTLVIAEFGIQGNDIATKIIDNSTGLSGVHFGLGTASPNTQTRCKRIHVTPAGNFVCSATTDSWHNGNGQADMLLFEISADFSTFNWIYDPGESDPNETLFPKSYAWDAEDFVIAPGTSPDYSVYLTGAEFNASTPNPTTLTNISGDIWPAGSEAAEQTLVLLTKLDAVGGSGGSVSPAWTQTYNFTGTGANQISYTSLNNEPYLSGGTPGHSGSEVVDYFANTHNDAGVGIIQSGPSQFTIAATVNSFQPPGSITDATLHSGGTDNASCYTTSSGNPTGFIEYKDAELVVFNTDLDGNYLSATPATEVMHCNGPDFKTGFAQDAFGNFYLSTTCGDNTKPSVDNIDNTINKYTGAISEMHIKKLDANFNELWEFTDAGNKALGETNYMHTCIFGITLNDEGGFIVGGNNNRNGDDFIVKKYYTDCDLNSGIDYSWPSSFPYENGILSSGSYDGGSATYNINGQIFIGAGVNVTLSNYTFQFANTRHIQNMSNMSTLVSPTNVYIAAGGSLTLNNCTLTGLPDCQGHNLQWDGIVVQGAPGSTPQSGTQQGTLILEDGTTIQNALYGVTVDGMYYAGETTDPLPDALPGHGWGNCETFEQATEQALASPPVTSIPPTQTNDRWTVYNQTYLTPGQGGGIMHASLTNFLNCRKGVQFSPYTGANNSFIIFSVFNNNAYMPEPINRQNGLNTHLSLSEVNGIGILGTTFEIDPSWYTNYAVNLRGNGIQAWDAQYTIYSATASNFNNLTYGINHGGDGTSATNINCQGATFSNNQVGILSSGSQNDVFSNNTFNTSATYWVDGIPIYGLGLITSNSTMFMACSNYFLNYEESEPYIGSWIISSGPNESSVSANIYTGGYYGLSTTYDNSGLFFRRNDFTGGNAISVTLNVDEGTTGYVTQNQDNLTGNDVPEDYFPTSCDFGGFYNIVTGDVYNPDLGGTPFQYQPLASNDVTSLNTACEGYWYDATSSIGISYNGSIDQLTASEAYPVEVDCNSDLATCVGCKALITIPQTDSATITERAQEIKYLMAPDSVLVGRSYVAINHAAKVANVIQYLENFKDWPAQQLLVPAYYELGQIDKMQTCIAGIIQSGEDVNNFKSLYGLLGNAKAQGRSEGNFTSEEWNTLRTYAKENKTYAGAIANNLLSHYKNEFNPYIPKFYKTKGAKSNATDLADTADNNGLIVFPNPMDEETTFKYVFNNNGDNQKGQIIVANIVGERVAVYDLSDIYGEIDFTRGDLASGVYFCSLMLGRHLIAVQKFVIE